LYLSIFEQPASRVFFSVLPVNGWSAIFDELAKKVKIVPHVTLTPGFRWERVAGLQCNKAHKTKKHPETNLGCFPVAAFSRKTTRSVSYLFANEDQEAWKHPNRKSASL
jgi:hypothetical protein